MQNSATHLTLTQLETQGLPIVLRGKVDRKNAGCKKACGSRRSLRSSERHKRRKKEKRENNENSAGLLCRIEFGIGGAHVRVFPD